MIETYPEDQISVKGGKGVRKTWLEGYSEVKDFYQPDYRVLPKENDYRRTLIGIRHCQRMNRERLIFVFTTTVVVNIPGLRLKL